MFRLTRVPLVVLLALSVLGCASPGSMGEAAVRSSATPRIPDTRGPVATAAPTPPPTTPAPPAAVTTPAPPAASATPAPATPPPTPAAEAPREAFAINLYRDGDFVPQYTFEWCVGASLQMMRNLTDAKVTRARSTQQDWWELARDRSSSPFGGANPRGWTAALNELGVGPYELVSVPDYDEALRVAASALRATNRPVGLVMWRGRHAWVMSGFTSEGDPRATDDFRVTGVRVLDPLYPHGHSTWGPSPKPNSLLTPARLGRQFVSRDRFRVNLGVAPGYLLVLPVEASSAG